MNQQTQHRAKDANPPGPLLSFARSAMTDMRAERVIDIIWQAVYAALLLALSAFFLTTWFSTTNINVPLKLIFLALLVLTLKRWTGAVLLALIQINLLFLRPWMIGDFGTVSQLYWIGLPLALISLVSRYRTLHDLHKRLPADSVRELGETYQAHRPSQSDTIVTNIRGVLRQLVRNAILITVCLVVAAKIMSFVPLYADRSVFDTIREFRLRPTGYRALILGFALFATWLFAWLIINEIVWRRLSPSQAAVYLRSVFLEWCHRDLRMIVLKRQKVRRKRTRKIKPMHEKTRAAPSEESNDADEDFRPPANDS